MNSILIVTFIFISGLVIWALFSKGEEAKPERKKADDPEDKPLRRRARDKQIEELFPDTESHSFRRKSDIESIEKYDHIEDDFKLPYSADDIIPESSRFKVFHRTLVNCEIYAKKGDFPTSISLYRGVYERIIDQDINAKIKANVDYLQEYQKINKHRRSETIKKKTGEKKGNEIRLLLDGPLNIPEKILIALSPQSQRTEADIISKLDINSIADKIADKIASKHISNAVTSSKDEVNSEISEIENRIGKLFQSKDGVSTEIDEIRKTIEGVKDQIEKQSVDTLSSEIQELKENDKELDKIKTGLQDLHNKITEMSLEGEKAKVGMERFKSELLSTVSETTKEPVVRESAFRSSADFIRDKIPEKKVPDPKIINFPGKKEELPRQKIETEKDEEEEIQVLADEDKEQELDDLSDEDIFEKILRDNTGKKNKSFEIVGYENNESNPAYAIIDKDQEEKEKEEENFYRKFLKHGKRVRKELPILRVSYDFSKLPDEFSLSKDQNILQYSFYKYKPMLEKANELIRRRNVRDAINYYKVVKEQNIPPEFKAMINKNINELTEYIEKYLAAD